MAGPVATAALTMASSLVSATSTIAGGNAAVAEAEYKAKQLRQQAAESRAGAQREAVEYRRKGELALSALQARAAASGGGATDATIVNLATGIGGRSEYQALAAMATGENQALGYEGAAQAEIASAEAKKKGAKLTALGTILGGAAEAGEQFQKMK
jgi:hypothetical protein